MSIFDAPEPNGPRDAVLRLLAGKWVVAAMNAAVQLELPEALAEGPRSLQALAQELGCHRESLERLLRVLVAEGLLDTTQDDAFVLTDKGCQLRRDSLGPLVAYIGSPAQWNPWAHLDHSVRTGRPAFDHTHGQSLYTYVAQHPEHAALYNRGVDHFTREQAAALAADPMFSEMTHVVDVGGGRGAVLVELLTRWPSLRGTLVDLEHVVRSPDSLIAPGGALADRAECVAGDFREGVPPGADCYVVKHVLHNWDDATCVEILSHCADGLAPGGRVVVVEGIVMPGNIPNRTRLLDLEMLVVTAGGRERRKPEFRALFGQAGLKLRRVKKLAAGAWCLEATR